MSLAIGLFRGKASLAKQVLPGLPLETAWGRGCYWDQALNPTQLGIYAAQAAQRLGVGMEIDYENNTSPQPNGAATIRWRLPADRALRRHLRESGHSLDHRPRAI